MKKQMKHPARNDRSADAAQEPRENSRLQDRVVLIINGLCNSGRVLARLLAQQGSDVAVVDSRANEELARSIRQDVAMFGRRCLILTAASRAARSMTGPHEAVQEIVAAFGRLDAFISYAAPDPEPGVDGSEYRAGRSARPLVFDRAGLTRAALKHILSRKLSNPTTS